MTLFSLEPYSLDFKPGWDRHFQHFDKSVQQRIFVKFERMKQPLLGRGLRSSCFQVEEVGGYRIAYIIHEDVRVKKIHFVGDHKQYEEWYSFL